MSDSEPTRTVVITMPESMQQAMVEGIQRLVDMGVLSFWDGVEPLDEHCAKARQSAIEAMARDGIGERISQMEAERDAARSLAVSLEEQLAVAEGLLKRYMPVALSAVLSPAEADLLVSLAKEAQHG